MGQKSSSVKRNNHEGLITLEDREINMSDARKSLAKVKNNPIEIAKKEVRTGDNFNTIFFLSPKKADDKEYVKQISVGVKIK